MSSKHRGKNPYASRTQPREYSAWYHEHNPGYFSNKTKQWLERQTAKSRSAFFAKRNRKSRLYISTYHKLSRRLPPGKHRAPTFTAKERAQIRNSDALTRMYRKVMGPSD